MNEQYTSKSTTGLVADAMSHVSSLVRSEVDLARAEIGENVNRAGLALGLLLGAVVIALVALNVLAAALVAAIAEAGLEAGWAALIVGAVLAVIALAMTAKAVKDLKLTNLAPTRTARNMKRDAAALKDAYNDK
jgi:hypothetical protein